MLTTKKRSFHYAGCGHALSAQFHRPFEEIIEVQAGMSLPIIGGHGRSRVGNFNFRDMVSFKSAHTYVSGSQDKADGSYNELVTVTLEGLNILDVITADRVVARLASQYHLPEQAEAEQEPRIVPVGSKFEGLRVGGCPLSVELDCDIFCKFDTYAALKKEFNGGPYKKEVQERLLSSSLGKDVPEFVRARYNWSGGGAFPESKETVLCSLVKNIEGKCPCVERYGNVLVVPQFGRIFLAEMFLQPRHRTLVMLRLELGSPVEGTLTAAQTFINGDPFP